MLGFLVLTQPAYATVDPLSVANNKVGIHLIDANTQESQEAANLLNTSGGDWGYVTVLIRDDDKKYEKWQPFFDGLRRLHLIPLVRLATTPQGDYWKTPADSEASDWANFLDSLNWPTKNRYVIIYNEPNHASEWGNSVDASGYAKALDATITALKSKSSDFFILNAGFDASAPQNIPAYEDEYNFLADMNSSNPGIFNKLDGWASHSYPNPNYVGSPDGVGRGTVRNYQWELSTLKSLGLNKNLPVFITETGWKHAEGISYDGSLPSSDQIGSYLTRAFQGAWSDQNIVAVTPFLLDYQQSPFDHFSFKRLDNEPKTNTVLGTSSDDSASFYPQYSVLKSLNKTPGQPTQIDSGLLIDGQIYPAIVSEQTYDIPLTFKNTGQAIWGEKGDITLSVLSGGEALSIQSTPSQSRVEPGQSITLHLKLTAPQSGNYNITLALFEGTTMVDTPSLNFTTKVKPPVILVVKATLNWKKIFSGSYLLSIISGAGESDKGVTLGDQGVSNQIEARDLLPDYQFKFTLQRPFYQSKTISKKLVSGVNTLDFGQLQPDIGSAILNPRELWKLLPWSN